MGNFHERRPFLFPVFAFVAVLLGASCSVDLSKLRARPPVDSGADGADATEPGVRYADAADAVATEKDTSLDHRSDSELGGEDSLAGSGVDGPSAMPEVRDVAESEDLVEASRDARADLILGTDATFDTGEAGGTEGGNADGTAGIDDAATTSETGKAFDTGGAGGADGVGSDGKAGIDDAAATNETGDVIDVGGDGEANEGDADGMDGMDGAAGSGETGDAFDTDWAGTADGGGADGMDGAAGSGETGGEVTPPAGLVARWKLDEVAGSSTAVDATGNGSNATLTGLNSTSAWTTGHTGGALRCDGSGGALVDDSAILDGITTGFTISAWVYRAAATTGFSVVLSRQIGTTSGEHYWLGLSGDNVGISSSATPMISTTAVPIGTWTHLAATHDGSTARIYVNGTQVFSRSSFAVFRADTSKLTICGNQNDASGSIIERWNGLIDDLQLYNRALTATEISGLAK
jgi:hypothetical protein